MACSACEERRKKQLQMANMPAKVRKPSIFTERSIMARSKLRFTGRGQ